MNEDHVLSRVPSGPDLHGRPTPQFHGGPALCRRAR